MTRREWLALLAAAPLLKAAPAAAPVSHREMRLL